MCYQTLHHTHCVTPVPVLCSAFHWLSKNLTKMTGVLGQMTCLSRFMSWVTNSVQLLSVLLPSKLYPAFIILSLTGFLSVSNSYTMSLHIVIGGAYSPHSNRFCNILNSLLIHWFFLFTQTVKLLWCCQLSCNWTVTKTRCLFSASTHTPSLSSCHRLPQPFLSLSH